MPGSAFDPQGKEGLMKLLAANVFPNAEAKEYFADQLGGSLDVESNYDYIQINASSKPENLVSMIETVANADREHGKRQRDHGKAKESQLKRISELAADPSYVADKAAAARLLGTFPYGRPEDGTAVDQQDRFCRIFWMQNSGSLPPIMRPPRSSVNFDEARHSKQYRRSFGAWLKADKFVPSTFRQPDDSPDRCSDDRFSGRRQVGSSVHNPRDIKKLERFCCVRDRSKDN